MECVDYEPTVTLFIAQVLLTSSAQLENQEAEVSYLPNSLKYGVCITKSKGTVTVDWPSLSNHNKKTVSQGTWGKLTLHSSICP